MCIIEYSGSHIKTTESHTVVSNGFTQQLMLDTFPSSKGCLHIECVAQGEVVCNIVNISPGQLQKQNKACKFEDMFPEG